MKRWWIPVCVVLALVLGGVAVWQLAVQSEPSDNNASEASVEDGGEGSDRAPTEEEIEELVSKLASQDRETFLTVWPSDFEYLVGEEAVQSLMVPEGSVVTASASSWSDDYNCWTIDVTIEASGEPLERTLLLGLNENQWRIYGTR